MANTLEKADGQIQVHKKEVRESRRDTKKQLQPSKMASFLGAASI
jgi:hypothetical protein